MQIVPDFRLERTVYKCHKTLDYGLPEQRNWRLFVRKILFSVRWALTWGVKTPPGQSRIKPWRHAFISFALFWYTNDLQSYSQQLRPAFNFSRLHLREKIRTGHGWIRLYLKPGPVKLVFFAKFSVRIIQNIIQILS